MANPSSKTELIGGVEKRQITIVDYDPAWPHKFETQRRIISEALGEAALQVEHIGSTSVVGLAAKPIIDILVVVGDAADEASYPERLNAAGYLLRVREPDWHEHRMFRTPEKDAHIHIFSVGCEQIGRHLKFRDRLRTSIGDRRRYEELKRALAAQDWPDMNAYANAKAELVKQIIVAAQT